MSLAHPRPTASQLRTGLHVLVVTLVGVVVVRAVLLGESRAGGIALVALVFVAGYVMRVRIGGSRLLLAVMVVAWVGLVLLGADAAYVSFGLFLVFLTELDIPWALVGVVGVTLFDIAAGQLRGETPDGLLAPALGALLSVLLGLGYRVLFEVTTAQQATIAALRRTRAELASSEWAAGQAAERARLAREIHDTIAQGLSSIQLLLSAAQAEGLPEQARGRIALAGQTAAAGLQEARRMLAELSPADLDGTSLPAALSRVCARSAAQVDFVVDGAARPVATPVEAALVRIAQGALANVERHAGPGARAVVSLGWSAGRVRLDVVDDGVGFDTAVFAAPSVATFGLDTIRTRVAELGGEFALESEPGHTALAVSFPIESPEAA